MPACAGRQILWSQQLLLLVHGEGEGISAGSPADLACRSRAQGMALLPRRGRQDQVQSTGTRITQQQFADMGLHLDAGVLAHREALAQALALWLQQAILQLVGACARRGYIFVRGRLTHITHRECWKPFNRVQGVWENDPIRKSESFATFEEVFKIAIEEKVWPPLTSDVRCCW